jgi:predicted dehydrogenase
VPYNWHWFWDTGNGDIGNQGVHEMDVARWAIKDGTLPKSVWSLGGRFGYDDQGQTPNTQLAVFDYGDALLVFEVRGLVGNPERGNMPRNVSNEYYTTEGMIREGKFYRHGSTEGEPLKMPEVKLTPGESFGSFIYAVRSRKPEDNNANAEVAHYSSALCHLANISYRLGQSVPYSKAAAALGDNKQVVAAFDNIRDNLKAVGMNLEETNYMLGRTLAFDAAAERFVGEGAEAANPMLRRPYRAPFVVPEQV